MWWVTYLDNTAPGEGVKEPRENAAESILSWGNRAELREWRLQRWGLSPQSSPDKIFSKQLGVVVLACNPSTWVLRQEDRGRKFEAILVWTIRPCLKQTIILVLILRKHWYCQSWLFCFWVFVCLFCFVHNGTGLITSLVALVSISLVINELSTFP